MSEPELEKDSQGNVITKPVVGWITAPMAGMAVILQMQYVDSPEQLDAGGRTKLQFVLTPQQCQELAETLTRQAARVMNSPDTGRRH